MATANTKEKCSMCNERMDLFDCRGCNNSFCFSHLLEHRENVKQEFHQIEDNYNSFQQTIIDQKNHPNQHLLIEKINQWENISFEKIKKTAEQCRKELTDYLNKFLTVVTDKSKDLFEELQQINKADKFSEIHLNELKEKLNKLKEELENLKHVSIEEENKSSFIRKLLVNIPIPIDLGNNFVYNVLHPKVLWVF
jgi:chromosome segregation ATPase